MGDIMNEYNVLYTVDSNYFIHFLTSIYSLFENNKDSFIVLHVIENGLLYTERNLLEKFVLEYNNVQLKVYEWNSSLEKYVMPKWRGTDIANARLFARGILSDVSKVLYLDSDTVIDNSLDKLFNNKCFSPVGAVLDFNTPYTLKGLVNNYFNSGVLLFDYDLWDREDCDRQLYDTFQNLSIPLVYPDQDLLNIAFSNKIDILDMKYNVTPFIYDMCKYPYLTKKSLNKQNYYSYDQIVYTLNNSYIYHMLGYFNERPWCFNNNHPFNSIYEKYRMKIDSSFESVKNKDSNRVIGLMGFTNMFFNSFLPDMLNYELKNKIKKIYKK